MRPAPYALMLAVGLCLPALQPRATDSSSTLQTEGRDGLQVASVFSDHMVLQRDAPVRIWGTGNKGERVTVRFDGQTQTAEVRDGSWLVTLDPM